ncbi:DUF2891 domain-containing protein [Marixanthomonas spongiae]|uniref:DUF2891 domain-containing protein n=1 Tax=Marixanthomonas spongiae TaxID=2174845 RepID=A0A2U0I0W6_9FLAO|nr:DUF2891 domain-containing protein [Marixanthomonas spongiae]PVW14753.1 DUF2891 domain-containing protein [Marixanthomonas spongiae]
MKTRSFFILLLSIIVSCNPSEEKKKTKTKMEPEHNTAAKSEIEQYDAPSFTVAEANQLIEFPLHCVENEYPNKLGQTIGSDEDLQSPEALHPIFYGCFDWHSAVHGYWSMVTLLKQFPDMEKADEIKQLLQKNMTTKNVLKELDYFQKDINKTYERTYGWAWLLKLTEALHSWDDPMAQQLAENLQPLTDEIVLKYKEYLPKLVYPIRVGEHTNTAFGLAFAWDYANATGDTAFKKLIEKRAKDFYLKDENCPITWEPSGYDFLSPCLEEVDIMRRVLSETEFKDWLDTFLPALKNNDYHLEPGKVGDRSDGKLVHLDGLNFSRAWVFYGLANQYPEYKHLTNSANEHVSYSYPNLVGDSYEGGHWLASFAIYALQQNRSDEGKAPH